MTAADAHGNMLDEWQASDPADETTGEQSVTVPGRPEAFAGADELKYTSSFADPRDPADDIAVLELRGLYAHSEVRVSGNRLDGNGPVDHDIYFRPLRIPFEPEAENDLTVVCHAPWDRFGGLHDTEMVPESRSVPGIWWGVSLESHPLPYIDRIDVQPDLSGDGAKLQLRTEVVSDEPLDERVTYSIKPAGDTTSRGMMQQASVETGRTGRTVHKHTVEVHDPALWWPRELGEQHRYTISAKLGETEHEVTTGICDLSFEDGHLSVNGQQFSIRGVNLLTDDRADIDRALSCNANLVRGHAQVLPEDLYERCDEAGILVWQDLPLTGAGEFDVERGTDLATALSHQYGRHPSLAVASVHDDPVDLFPNGLGSETFDRLRLRYRAWRSSYDSTSAETVANAFPAYLPTVPVVSGPGVDSQSGSYYPGWSYGAAEDIGQLLDRYPVSVVAEFGAGALAGELDPDADVAGFNRTKHDRHVPDGTEKSQAYQAAVVRTITERLRQRRMGAIVCALRDTDEAGCGVYTHDGEHKVAADTLTQAFQPIQAFLSEPEARESKVIVINDTPQGLSADLKWVAGENSGTIEVTVGETGRWTGGPIEIPADAENVSLKLSVGDRIVTNTYEW